MSDRIHARMAKMFGEDVATEIVASGRMTVIKDKGGGVEVCAFVSDGCAQGARLVRIFLK